MDPARKPPQPQGYPRPSTLLAVVACTFAALLLVFLWVPSFFEPKFENHGALLFLNILLLSAVSVWTAWLSLQGYRRSGRSEMLSAGCGFLVFGSGALMAGVAFASFEANDAVTVYSLAALASGAFHLHAALRSGRTGMGADTPSAPRAVLTFTAAIAVTGLFWAAADADLLPPFYRSGTAGTPVRLVAGSIAIALFGAAAAMRFGRPGRPGMALAFQLYGEGLLLTALGLLAIMIAPPGSVICWGGRAATYTGSLFFLAAFLTAIRMARRKGLGLRQALSEFHLQSDEHLRALVANSPSAVISVDDGNRVYLWNPSAEALFGFSEAEVTGRSVIELLAPDDASASALGRVLSDRADGRIDRLELNLRCGDGALKPVELTAFASGRGGSATSLILRDITEQRAAEREAAAALELLGIVNRCESSRELGREAVAFFRRVSGCQAVGVRVRNGLDFPYLAAEGYPEEFLPSEKVLCAKAPSDGPSAGDSASPMLECLCGATIAGGLPPGAGCATTAGGSFWTASIGRQLSEWRGLQTIGGLRLRAHCVPQGFESMTLIPLRVGEATIGLIQIADPVPERFGLEAVAWWETLAGYLAVAFGRLLSQEESRTSDDRLRAFASATFEGIVFSREGRIVDCNHQLAAMLGYPKNELLGKAVGDLVAPEDRERVLGNIRWGREPAIVHRLVRKDGSAITVEAHGKAMGEKGMESRCTALRDISERVRTERSLREGEEKLHLALQSARAGEEALRRLNSELEQRVRERTLELEGTVARLQAEVAERTRVQTQLHQLSRVFMDASDSIIIENLDGTVIDMNREAERVYGYRREELIGKPVRTLFLPERYPIAEQLRERCRNGEEVRNWEALRLDKSGRTLSLLVAAFPLMDEGGRVISIATIAKDVTLRTLMQEELQRSKERLQELSYHSITALEADRQAVSRELHDSIGGSLAAIGYALEDVETKIPSDPAAAVSTLQRTITHLRQTIKESKRISVNLRPLTLDDLGLLSTIDWYTGQFMQNYPHIRVSRKVEVAEAEVPEQLKIVIYRVLQEALTNAARHSRAKAVAIRLKKGNGMFTLEITDNGCGFEPEKLAQSGDRTAGMGLKSMGERTAICGGILTVDSRPGKGTRIRAALPEVIEGMNGPAII